MVNIFGQLLGLEEVIGGDENVMTDDLVGKEDAQNTSLMKTMQTNHSDFL